MANEDESQDPSATAPVLPAPRRSAAPAPGAALATVVVTTEAGRHGLLPRMVLRTVGGGGEVYASSAERLVVGSDERADVVLADHSVSRFHCEIGELAGRVRVRDLGSRNGTLVEGVPVLEAWLPNGATLTVGRTKLRFEIGDAKVTLPLGKQDRFGAMVGTSVAMLRAFAALEVAAASESPVLLTGEAGTGKALAAASIHRASRRKAGPFVVVPCAAIPADALDDALFGSERGAFHAARSGTVFLEEIGELPIDVQPKLVRAIEKREVLAVGSAQFTPIDVRVIAGTTRDLRAAINAKRFRSDLHARVAELEVRLPPLRERDGDLPLLVDALFARMGAKSELAATLRTPAFHADLARRAWTGNVAELRAHLERCLALRADPSHPPPWTLVSAPGADEA